MAKSDLPEPSEGLAARFQALWESSPSPPDVMAFLRQHPDCAAIDRVGVLRVDQRYRWRRGKPLSLQVYLRYFPEIARRPDLVRLLVEGDRNGRRESNALAADLLEGFREIDPSHAATQVIVRPRDDNLTVADDQEHAPEPSSTGLFADSQSGLGSTQDVIPGAPEDRLDFELGGLPTGSLGRARVVQPSVGSSRFSLLRRLGAGGMGVVYEAFDEARGELIALKTMRRVDPTALFRFKQEFRTLSDISHPNLVNLYQLFSVDDRWYFTMELVDGCDFLTYVRGGSGPRETGEAETPDQVPEGRPAFDEGRLREALAQLAEGVHALHGAGKLHRDIKPTNVLVTRSGRVVLLDFGLTADLEMEPSAGTRGAERQVVGTAAHMSPEQALGLPLTTSSDWYSVGVILYTALAGRLPFDGTFEEVMFRKQRHDPPDPETLVQGLPADLTRLCMALLDRDPRRRPGGDEIVETLRGRERPGRAVEVRRPRRSCPLVGRLRHRRVLEDAYDALAAGRPGTVFLLGRTGAGKTTLIRAFLDDLLARGDTLVLAGRCYEQEWVPFKAVDSLVDALARHLKRLSPRKLEEILPRDVGYLARVFPVLRGVEGIARSGRQAGEMPDPQELRLRVFAALRELLARLGRQMPLVLAVDDLQWGDADSAALLADLLHTADPPLVLFLGAFRLEDVEQSRFYQVVRQPGEDADSRLTCCELVVESLTQSESRELALALLGRDDAVSRALAHQVARESAGNPLFIDELVRHIRAGALTDGWEAAGKIDLETVIRQRVGAQPMDAQRLLETVSVAGRPIDQSLAFRAAELGTGGRIALGSLRSARLIRSTGPAEREQIEAYHARIRETVLSHLSAESLRWYHERLGRLMETEPQADPEVVADHLRGAGEGARAAEYYARAADKAAHALAFDHAARLYRLALDLHPGPVAGHRGLARKLGDALANGGRGAEAASVYLEAAERTTAAETLELKRLASAQLLTCGHVDEGLALLRTILGPLGLRVPSTPQIALISLVRDRALLGLRGYRFRSRDETQVSAEDLSRIDACWAAVIGLSIIDPLLGAYFQTRGLRLALRVGEPFRVVRALAMEAAHLSTTGSPAAARVRAVLGTAEELAAGLDTPQARGMIHLVRGISGLMLGQWDRSRTALDQAETLFRNHCTGVTWERDTVSSLALWDLLYLGRIAELRHRWSVLTKEAQERGDLYAATTLTTSFMAIIRLADDDPAGVEEELAGVVVGWTRRGFSLQHASAFRSLMQLDLYLGRVDSAWERAGSVWPEYSRSMLLRIQFIRIQMLELRARSALAVAEQGKPSDAALISAGHDARRLEREGQGWALAHAHYVRAGIAACREDSSTAVHHLQRAAETYDSVDMPLHGCVMRYRIGQVQGGDEGRSSISEARSWMRSQSIQSPARWAAMYAPGFSKIASSHIETTH